MTLRKHGGLWFFRIGRLGGSLYLARPTVTRRFTRKEWRAVWNA